MEAVGALDDLGIESSGSSFSEDLRLADAERTDELGGSEERVIDKPGTRGVAAALSGRPTQLLTLEHEQAVAPGSLPLQLSCRQTAPPHACGSRHQTLVLLENPWCLLLL